MPETPETHGNVAKMQKDIEELKEDVQDAWHFNRERYQKMLDDVLSGHPNYITLYLEIDGLRSIKEIEEGLATGGHKIPHVTLWFASQQLLRGGLIRKMKIKSKSPVFAKKRWALALHLDEYVRDKFIQQENKPQA